MALGLSTLSFAAGVAGDLSIIDPPRSGQRVVLRIPPELPTDTVRAAPLQRLISTASATEVRVERIAARLDETAIFVELPEATASHKPPARLEIQLARIMPKAAPALASAKDGREAA